MKLPTRGRCRKPTTGTNGRCWGPTLRDIGTYCLAIAKSIWLCPPSPAERCMQLVCPRNYKNNELMLSKKVLQGGAIRRMCGSSLIDSITYKTTIRAGVSVEVR